MKLSKPFYIGSIVGAPIVAIGIIMVGFVGAMGGASSGSEDLARAAVGALMGSVGLALLALLYGFVVQLVLIYNLWSAINDGQARTTPGMAAGLMLVPLFNLYWIFQAIYGFAQDYNKYIARHGYKLPQLDEKLFLFYPISVLACAIPLVGAVAGMASLVLAILVAIKAIDAVNALSDTPRTAVATA